MSLQNTKTLFILGVADFAFQYPKKWANLYLKINQWAFFFGEKEGNLNIMQYLSSYN